MAVAASVTFLTTQSADWAVYNKIRNFSRSFAVLCSGIAGATVDTVIAHYVSFGEIGWDSKVIFAKLYATLIYTGMILWDQFAQSQRLLLTYDRQARETRLYLSRENRSQKQPTR